MPKMVLNFYKMDPWGYVRKKKLFFQKFQFHEKQIFLKKFQGWSVAFDGSC